MYYFTSGRRNEWKKLMNVKGKISSLGNRKKVRTQTQMKSNAGSWKLSSGSHKGIKTRESEEPGHS